MFSIFGIRLYPRYLLLEFFRAPRNEFAELSERRIDVLGRLVEWRALPNQLAPCLLWRWSRCSWRRSRGRAPRSAPGAQGGRGRGSASASTPARLTTRSSWTCARGVQGVLRRFRKQVDRSFIMARIICNFDQIRKNPHRRKSPRGFQVLPGDLADEPAVHGADAPAPRDHGPRSLRLHGPALARDLDALHRGPRGLVRHRSAFDTKINRRYSAKVYCSELIRVASSILGFFVFLGCLFLGTGHQLRPKDYVESKKVTDPSET